MGWIVRHKQLSLGIGLLVAVIVGNAAVNYRLTRQLRDNSNRVAHTLDILAETERLRALLTDAETGQRGYLITGDEDYLEPYLEATRDWPQSLARVESLTRDNPEQRERIPQLRALIAERLDVASQTIDLRRTAGLEAAQAIVVEGRGKRLMDEIRKEIAAMQRRERALLDDRQVAHQGTFTAARFSQFFSVLLALSTVGAFVWLFLRHLRELGAANLECDEQRKILHATLVSIGDGVIATDSGGLVTFLNGVAQKLTGWTQVEARDQPLERIFQIVNEVTRQPVENPALRAVREGRVMGLANHTILLSRDGTEWPIDDSAAPILSDEGVVTGAVLVFREISERKQKEQELARQSLALADAARRKDEMLEAVRQSEEQFRTLADSIPQLAWMARPDGYILWYNRRFFEYTGTRFEQVQGWAWEIVVDPDELPRVTASWKAGLARGTEWEDHVPIRRHDGAMRWHLSRAMPVRDAAGKIIRWFGTNTDVTEHQELEQALRHADRRKDEFLAILAHELRNPLAPLSNALQIWPLVRDKPEEMERLRELMDRQLGLMTRLVDDLLDVSRITRGKIQLRSAPVDLRTLLFAAVEALQPFIEACGHRLTTDVPPTAVTVQGDATRLTQVIGNILHNAAKYTGRDGTIQAVVAVEGHHATIRIRDNGPGIPEHMLGRIFEMFQQVDQTLDRSHGGLGIGLTLVQRLVQLHGGHVEARNPADGPGAEFVVTLPLHSAPVHPAEPGMAVATGAAPAEASFDGVIPACRALVVDDVPASARTLAMMLQSLDQEVTVVFSGAEALAAIAQSRPEVVFLDISMPGMDGYETARRIRADAACAGVYLVALTGYGEEEIGEQVTRAGFDRHLTKPASLESLIQVLVARGQ